MSIRTLNSVLISSLLGIILCSHRVLGDSPGITLYTPFTKISVPPGESISYNVDVINNSSAVKNVDLSVSGLPKDWSYDIKSGNLLVSEISVLPGEKKSLTFRVEVPQKVNKGSYTFSLVARGITTLPLTIIVSEQGTFKTEFTTTQPNMEGNSNSSFTFNTQLKNRTAEQQLYSLRADVPRGWNVTFRAGGRQVTSVQTAPNNTENVTVEFDPPDGIEAGSYKIPVTAQTSTTSATLELEVVIRGSYAMELTTPTGLLSTSVTAGDERRVELMVKNTGSTDLANITFTSSAPINWDVTFDPKNINKLEPGKTAQVFATIKADKKAISGDYVTNIEAKTPEVTSKAAFRVSVKTSMLYGWIGVLIIGGAIGGVFYLFRKYGRR